jgi:hemerythrin-like domain-containing protein
VHSPREHVQPKDIEAEEIVPAIIESLLQDHRNMETLLRILEQELAVFDRAERPDFDILTGIIEYFRSFPTAIHQPKENLVSSRLAARAPERAKPIIDIEAEHGQAAMRLERFAKLVDSVLDDRELPRAALDTAAAEFIAHERRHMQIEEQELFPAARASLTSEDWTALDAKLGAARDPLFNRQVELRFESLHKRLAAWEREDQRQRDLFRNRH